MLRHANTLAEKVYVKISSDSQILAMKRLPYLFPDDEHGKSMRGVLTPDESADYCPTSTLGEAEPQTSQTSESAACLAASPGVETGFEPARRAALSDQVGTNLAAMGHSKTHSDVGNKGRAELAAVLEAQAALLTATAALIRAGGGL